MLHKQQKHEWIKAAKADRVLMQPTSQAGEDAVAERVMGDLVQALMLIGGHSDDVKNQ